MRKTKGTKIAKERILFSNYPGWISEDELRRSTAYSFEIDEADVTDDQMYEEENELSEIYFNDFKMEVINSFDRIMRVEGTLGLWNGTHTIVPVEGSFEYLFTKAIHDCDFYKVFDVNGHLYLKCSHHDGTNVFEFKERSLNSNSWVLPRVSEKVFGCPAREYEKANKENLLEAASNKASSRYC